MAPSQLNSLKRGLLIQAWHCVGIWLEYYWNITGYIDGIMEYEISIEISITNLDQIGAIGALQQSPCPGELRCCASRRRAGR